MCLVTELVRDVSECPVLLSDPEDMESQRADGEAPPGAGGSPAEDDDDEEEEDDMDRCQFVMVDGNLERVCA